MTRAELHQIVDTLPEGVLSSVGKIMRELADVLDPVGAALDAAPYDDEEPLTEEEERELQEGFAELARGEAVSFEEAFRD